MFLLKKYVQNRFHILRWYKYYGSGVNPLIVDDSPKHDKYVLDNQRQDNRRVMNPFSHVEESMGISPFFDNSSKDILNSIQLPSKSEGETKTALPFDEVPGPYAVRYIANMWKYIPAAGAYFKLHERVRFLSFLFDHYGPVVRVVGPFGGDIVLLSRPEHMQSVFNQEGPQPVRSAFDSLEYYRKNYRKFDFPGLYSVQGKEWNHQRTVVENSLKDSLSKVKDQVNICSDELITLIPKLRNRHDEVEAGFENRLFKWSLECMGHILLGERLRLLEGYESPQGDALWLEEALSKASAALAACETGLQVWKVMETPAFKKLVENCDAMDSIIGQYVRQTEIELHNRKHKDKKLVYSTNDIKPAEVKVQISDTESRAFIKALLLSEKMKSEDILTSFIDMMIVGVNSSTSAMSFILYHLSRSQRAQNVLVEELNKNFPANSVMTYEKLSQLPYLKACIKESLRLVPPFPVLTRILPKSIVVDHYKIPHGTTMIMAMQVSGLKEEHFDDSKRYYPERWLKVDVKEFHPLATLPFGFGSRKCIGQGLAEIMLATLTAKIIKKFKVEYNYGDVVPATKLIAMPNCALKFRFIDRE